MVVCSTILQATNFFMKIKNIAKNIVNSRKRQKMRVERTYLYIHNFLKESRIPFSINKYKTFVPNITMVKLTADGKIIQCKGTSFISGTINNSFKVMNEFHSDIKTINTQNINTNNKSSHISRPNFYFATSVAVAKKDITKIKKAQNIKGKVLVKKEQASIKQLLIGNTENPKYIIFSHYDSIDTGALDNASGVAVSLFLISKHEDILKDSLFVMDGNEELSYDYPIYWGHGYRVFEQKYKKILTNCKKIIIVDCVGNGKTQVTSNKKILKSAFPIQSINEIIHKTCTLHGNINKLFSIYHSERDTVEKLKESYLQDAVKTLIKLIK